MTNRKRVRVLTGKKICSRMLTTRARLTIFSVGFMGPSEVWREFFPDGEGRGKTLRSDLKDATRSQT